MFAATREKRYEPECRRVKRSVSDSAAPANVRLLMVREDPVEIPLKSSGVRACQ